MSATNARENRRAELLARCEAERQELRITRAHALAVLPRVDRFAGWLRTLLRLARILARVGG